MKARRSDGVEGGSLIIYSFSCLYRPIFARCTRRERADCAYVVVGVFARQTSGRKSRSWSKSGYLARFFSRPRGAPEGERRSANTNRRLSGPSSSSPPARSGTGRLPDYFATLDCRTGRVCLILLLLSSRFVFLRRQGSFRVDWQTKENKRPKCGQPENFS